MLRPGIETRILLDSNQQPLRQSRTPAAAAHGE